jgi:acetylornithine deacetylase/succinyl-diaminopimelate desuccinylase-like protein
MTVAALEELVAIPSVSSDPARRDDVRKAAKWLAKRLNGLNGRVAKTAGHPLVLGEWLGAEGAPTVLVYAHYDVQPVGEEAAWRTPPFEPVVRDDRMYGRGTSDDKGPMLAALGAIERLLDERGRLPVNVRILLEGEEEIGSPSLEPALFAHRSELAADVAISADGAMWSAEQPSVNVAARGMLAVEVAVRGPSADLHSGRHGGAVTNPLQALSEILASLHRPDGSIAVDGFMDEVVELTGDDRFEIAEMPFDERAYRAELGVPELHGEPGYTPLERLTARPTLEISQVEGGGRYTVIPAVARAYLTCRLVPNQDPARIAAAIARHVLARCPDGATASVEEVPGGIPAYSMRPGHPALAAAEEALRAVYPGRKVLRTRAGGTLPAAVLLRRALGLDTLLFSFSSSDEGFHGPNEFFRLSRLRDGTDAWARLLDLLGERL